MQRGARLIICLLLSAAAGAGCLPKRTRTFDNPVLSGSYPDPSVCRVGDDYYLVHSSFEYFPGVPIFHSRDLVHWQQIGHVLTRPSQLPLQHVRASGGIYAPTIRYHEGTFYVITTNIDGGGNFYVTAKDPAGPWSEPVWVDREGIDPSLFFDEDGTVYYTRHQGAGDGHIAQAIIDIGTGELKTPLKNIWEGTGGAWAEAPHLYKVKESYYLMISEGGTSYDHMVTIARSDDPFGPYEANPANPILTHRDIPTHPIQAVGHADMVETPDGWWMVALGIRPQPPEARFHHMGRETYLMPVAFDESGWPVVNGKGTIDSVMAAPALPNRPWPEADPRDEFDAEALPLHWNYLRNPYGEDYSLTERPGFLRLIGSKRTLLDQDSPAFIGRRQTELDLAAGVRLEFDPRKPNEEAGLVVMANDRNHYQVGLTLVGGKRMVFLRKVIDGKIVTPIETVEISPGPVILSVSATPTTYTFWVQSASPPWTTVYLGTPLARYLSVESIGSDYGMCFTGVYIGVYATGNGVTSTSPADFDWFVYQPA